jgi:Tetratricopeptide repeat/LytR cell envelope-related transcriptional attenuator
MTKLTLLTTSAVAVGLVGLSACTIAPLNIRPVNTSALESQAPSSKVDLLYAQGREALVAGDLAAALELFHGARRSGPDDVRVLNGLAVIYDRLGRYDLSANYYDRARELDPNSAVLQANLALSNQMRARYGLPSQTPSTYSETRQQLASQQAQITPQEPVATSSDKPAWEAPASAAVIAPQFATTQLPPTDAPSVAVITYGPPSFVETAPQRLPFQPQVARPAPTQVNLPSASVRVARPNPAPHVARLTANNTIAPRAQSYLPSLTKPSWSRPAVIVINGTSVRGQATRTAQHLRVAGWVVVGVGNERPYQRTATLINYGIGQRQQALMVARAMRLHSGSMPSVLPTPHNNQIQVRLGRDSVSRAKAPRRI